MTNPYYLTAGTEQHHAELRAAARHHRDVQLARASRPHPRSRVWLAAQATFRAVWGAPRHIYTVLAEPTSFVDADPTPVR